MKKSSLQVEAKFFRGLSDWTRLSVIETLITDEKSVGEIVEAKQSNRIKCVEPLKVSLECGLVKVGEGKRPNMFYSLRDKKTQELFKTSKQVISKSILT